MSASTSYVADDEAERRERHRPAWRQLRISLGLFVLTFVSAMWSQVLLQADPNEAFWDLLTLPIHQPARLLQGLPFGLTLMSILLAHEMGHYLTARHYGVDQSPPFFIPAPTIFGTFGAVILMRSQPANRRELLHLAAMGPYAGLVIAIPAAIWGLMHSTPVDVSSVHGTVHSFGSSLLFATLEHLFAPKGGSDIMLHQVGLAGWAGLFVTSLNLIPAAQLDGGHIAYALLGPKQHVFSLWVVATLLGFGLFRFFMVVPTEEGDLSGGEMWIFWALLLFVVGIGHPPVRDESVTLTRADKINGLIALVVFVLTFIPVPISVATVHSGKSQDGREIPFDFLDETDPPKRPGAVPKDHSPAEEFRL